MASQSFKYRCCAWAAGVAILSSLGTACGDASTPASTQAVATEAAATEATPTVAPAHLAHPVRVTVNGTHVHSTASVTSPPVGLVFGNDSVDYLGRYNDQWAKIRLRDGTTGFLATEYLEGMAPKSLAKPVAQTSASVKLTAPAPQAAAPKAVVPKAAAATTTAAKTVAAKTLPSKAVIPKTALSAVATSAAATPEVVTPPARLVFHQGDLAYYCASGNVVKYHSSPDCRGLKKCQATVENMPLSEAEASMSPCKLCH